MARPLRIEYPGAFYHVTSRGNQRKRIFTAKSDYHQFKKYLKQAQEKYGYLLHSYVQMSNHYHLLLRQDGDEPVGKLLQRIFNSYTKAFNKRYERKGTLFEGPYRAIHIDRESYLLHVCRYIHANPVKHRWVDHLDRWPYSNYHEWIGARCGTLVDLAFVREHFAIGADYVRFVQEYLDGLANVPRRIETYLID